MAVLGFHQPGRAVQLGGTEEECQEDGRDGLPSLSGSVHPVGSIVQETEDERGTIVPGEAASQGAVFRVWVVDGFGVAGSQ